MRIQDHRHPGRREQIPRGADDGLPRTLKLVLTKTGQPVLALKAEKDRVIPRMGLAVDGLDLGVGHEQPGGPVRRTLGFIVARKAFVDGRRGSGPQHTGILAQSRRGDKVRRLALVERST
jgi:hypothetical protein